MNTKELPTELQTKLIETASRRCWQDSFDEPDNDGVPADTIDDAFDGGVQTGETMLARKICKALGILFEIETE
jgi:hypothetical protein